MGLGFLQGHHIRIGLREPVPFSLGGYRAQAVDVPGYKFELHKTSGQSIALLARPRKLDWNISAVADCAKKSFAVVTSQGCITQRRAFRRMSP